MTAGEDRFPERQLTEEEYQAGAALLRARYRGIPESVLTRMLAEQIASGMAAAGFPVRERQMEE